jgi:hypothetical protein
MSSTQRTQPHKQRNLHIETQPLRTKVEITPLPPLSAPFQTSTDRSRNYSLDLIADPGLRTHPFDMLVDGGFYPRYGPISDRRSGQGQVQPPPLPSRNPTGLQCKYLWLDNPDCFVQSPLALTPHRAQGSDALRTTPSLGWVLREGKWYYAVQSETSGQSARDTPQKDIPLRATILATGHDFNIAQEESRA